MTTPAQGETRGRRCLRANSRTTIDERADNELTGRWWVGRFGQGVSPRGSAGLRSSVYSSSQYLRDRSEVTRVGTAPVEMAAYTPSPGVRPFDQIPLATPEAANAVTAVWIGPWTDVAMTPELEYEDVSTGQMNVLPCTLRPLWITPVAQLRMSPVPEAQEPAPPVADTVAPPVPAHTPVSCPVALSSSSPELGMLQTIPDGTNVLIALKSATASETFGDATP
jgi:hypothetical protein